MIFGYGGLLVVLGDEDDMLAASMGCLKPWIYHGGFSLSNEFEYFGVGTFPPF
jgi:hypothetical protein